MKPRKERKAFFACPNCGAPVAAGAAACRECGSDANTGWKDDDEVDYASIDLPDGYRDRDDRFARDELPPSRTPRWIVITALVTAAALIAGVTGVLAFR